MGKRIDPGSNDPAHDQSVDVQSPNLTQSTAAFDNDVNIHPDEWPNIVRENPYKTPPNNLTTRDKKFTKKGPNRR